MGANSVGANSPWGETGINHLRQFFANLNMQIQTVSSSFVYTKWSTEEAGTSSHMEVDKSVTNFSQAGVQILRGVVVG